MVKHLGVMLDCSRNAVMNVPAVKKYIDILKRLGHNTLMLYTEDTFEVENQPYFGYLRGRYTQEELREIDAYACTHGIELIPCVQTLAHLNAIVRWETYNTHTDVADILLCDDYRTDQLIEDIFSTISKCFTSRRVHIGMDEAHMVGLGKYLDLHGYQNRFQLLIRHLRKVCGIAQKHGFQPMMWSDMFFRLVNAGDYTRPADFGAELIAQVPEEVGLVYWDYYYKDKPHYDDMIRSHRQFSNELWFAGGLRTWCGFAPKNGFSMDTIDAAVPSLLENGVEHVIFTQWGDDGQECSHFATLPSLYYATQKLRGVEDKTTIKEGFYREFGIEFDEFLLLDLEGTTDNSPNERANPEKFMFYNDCFSGIFDCTVPEGFEPRYTERAEKLRALAEYPVYGVLFDSAAKLCDFLQLKYTIGIRTRNAYHQKDMAAMQTLIADYEQMLVLLEQFYQSHKKRWFAENKPHGFDVQDIRIGGLKQRIISCRDRLIQFASGHITVIEELEEQILPEFSTKDAWHNCWAGEATVNTISWGMISS